MIGSGTSENHQRQLRFEPVGLHRHQKKRHDDQIETHPKRIPVEKKRHCRASFFHVQTFFWFRMLQCSILENTAHVSRNITQHLHTQFVELSGTHAEQLVMLMRLQREPPIMVPRIGRRARARPLGGVCLRGRRSVLRGMSALPPAVVKAKARGEPPLLQQRVRHAWLFRWGSMLACAGARALALFVG